MKWLKDKRTKKEMPAEKIRENDEKIHIRQ